MLLTERKELHSNGDSKKGSSQRQDLKKRVCGTFKQHFFTKSHGGETHTRDWGFRKTDFTGHKQSVCGSITNGEFSQCDVKNKTWWAIICFNLNPKVF